MHSCSFTFVANRDATARGLPPPFLPPIVLQHSCLSRDLATIFPEASVPSASVAQLVGLASLAQALPHFSAEDVVCLHQHVLHPMPGCHYPFNTSNGPSHCTIVASAEELSLDALLALGPQISRFVNLLQCSLMVTSFRLGYGGLAFSTSCVPTSPELAQVETFVCGIVPKGTVVDCEVPSLWSFCKLVSVPFITLEGTYLTLAGAECILLSTVFKDNIHLAALPWIVRDSHCADSCTVFFDIWDFQKESRMKTFVNRLFNIGQVVCFFYKASPHIGVPYCSCCCSWGHNLDYCHFLHMVCPICMGPHHEDNHRAFAACCKGKPNHVLPVPPTTDGEPCPHAVYCLNCGKPHATNSCSCQFWQHHFNHVWINACYQSQGEGEIPCFRARLLTGETSIQRMTTVGLSGSAEDVQMADSSGEV